MIWQARNEHHSKHTSRNALSLFEIRTWVQAVMNTIYQSYQENEGGIISEEVENSTKKYTVCSNI